MSLNQSLDDLNQLFPETEARQPALFIGHGSPMNAIEENPFSRAWLEMGKTLPHPNAILCISAHWETTGAWVTGMPQPRTIHDFGGFPRPLYEMRYPAPGSPGLARLAQETLRKTPVQLDQRWGLDHGAWSVLGRLFPKADVPVIQLSLDASQPPEFHYSLGQELRSLRRRGVLIVGSGNMVHNLGRIAWQGGAYDWAVEFDQTLKSLIETGNHAALIDYPHLGTAARLSIPTNEHYLPLLYILALQESGDRLQFFADEVVMGSISMRSLRIG